MGSPSIPNDVKLIAGFIFRDPGCFELARARITDLFGEADYESPALDFSATGYYEEEFGKDLRRKFLSLKRPVKLEDAGIIKLNTNEIESSLAFRGKRRINIDPGYLNLSKLVLFTTKDYSHRVHIADAIFAEVALYFKDGTFNPFPWTYPDFKTKDYIDIFNSIREIYKTGRQR